MEICMCLCEAKDMLNQQNLWIPNDRNIDYAIFTIIRTFMLTICLEYKRLMSKYL